MSLRAADCQADACYGAGGRWTMHALARPVRPIVEEVRPSERDRRAGRDEKRGQALELPGETELGRGLGEQAYRAIAASQSARVGRDGPELTARASAQGEGTPAQGQAR